MDENHAVAYPTSPHGQISSQLSKTLADLWVPLYFKEHSSGGGKRTRTADLLVANQPLSHLSYAPTSSKHPQIFKRTFLNLI